MRTGAKLVTAALLLAASLPLAAPYSLDDFPSSSTLTHHGREFNVVGDANGVPQLEPWENAAQDPVNVLDVPISESDGGTSGKDYQSEQVPSPTELDDDVSNPLNPQEESPEPAALAQPSSTPSPQEPEEEGLAGPEAAITVPPAGSGQPNSQMILGGGDENEPEPSPVQLEVEVPSEAPSVSPWLSASPMNPSSAGPGFASQQSNPTPEGSPQPSDGAMDGPTVTPTVPGASTAAEPSLIASPMVSMSPLPSTILSPSPPLPPSMTPSSTSFVSANGMESAEPEEQEVEESFEPMGSGATAMPSPSPYSSSAAQGGNVMSEVSPTATSSPVPSTLQSNGNDNDDDVALIPVPGKGFTCLYFGEGTFEQFLVPDPNMFIGSVSKYTAGPAKFPSLSPQYLSHTYGSLWSYSVQLEPQSAYDVVLGFAEVYEAACLAGAGYRQFSVTIGDQTEQIDVMDEVGCGAAVKKAFKVMSPTAGVVTVTFESIAEKAMLSTLCFRKTGAADTPASLSSPEPTGPVPSSEIVASGDIAVPGEEYACVNFGPKGDDSSYIPYNKGSVLGDTMVYNGSAGVQDQSLPIPYRSHLYGKSWTYQLDVSTDANQKIVLGFAEVYPAACASGSNASFRVFTVSVAGDVQTLNIMKSAGCEVVEQVVFDNVSPQYGVVDVSLSASSGDAMMSVLCYKDSAVMTPEPSPELLATAVSPGEASQSVDDPVPSEANQAVPTTTASVSALPIASRAPAQSPKAIPTALPPSGPPPTSASPDSTGSSSTNCFKFGSEEVSGFGNVLVPDLGEGVEFFSNPLATVKGTPYSSVYATHIYGPQFTLTVQTDSITPKSIVLGFAEVFQPGCREGYRVFNVSSGPLTQAVDVYKEVGCNSAFDLRVDGIVPSSSGTIAVSFSATSNYAMLSAVCVYNDMAGKLGIQPSKLAPDGQDSGFSSLSLDATSIVVSSTTTSGGAMSPSPSEVPSNSPSAMPSETPTEGPLPQEDGAIISEPIEATSEATPEEELVELNVTSQDVGSGPSASNSVFSTPMPPMPTDELLPSNFSQTTMGSSSEPSPSPTPWESHTATSTGENNVLATITPGVDAGGPIAAHTPDVVSSTSDGDGSAIPSFEAAGDTEEMEGSEASQQPFATPSISALPASPTAAMPDGTPIPSPIVSPQATAEDDVDVELVLAGEPSSTTMPASQSASVTVSGSSSGPMPSGSSSPQPARSMDISTSPEATAQDSSFAPTTDPEGELPGEPLAPMVTGEPEASTEPWPVITAIPPASLGTSGNAGSGVPEQNVDGNPDVSPGAVTLAPSPAGDRQPDIILPPVESPVSVAPQPSVSSGFGPTVTPTPSIASSISPSPIEVLASPDPSEVLQTPEPSPSPSPSPADNSGSPPGVVIGEPSASPGTTGNTVDGDASPSPSASSVSSTTGSDEVIVISGTTVPTLEPDESIPEVAPPDPVPNAPDNTDGIEVTDGSEAANDATVNPDATSSGSDGRGPTIIAGEFKDRIGTRPLGNGFAIGMGVLGSLLVLLLFVCLFFAIFRGRGDAYSYSSQYSAHKPTDYDPSQGGYTDDLGPGTGGYGNSSVYGAGAQDGYGGGETLESVPPTQNGSFTYEGATDLGGTGGSGYGQNDAGLGGSTYGNAEPDTFAEYSSLHVQQPDALEKSQPETAADFTVNDTITMPASNYDTGVTTRYDENQYGTGGHESTTETILRTSASLHANHMMVQPTYTSSESSEKQESDSLHQDEDRPLDFTQTTNDHGFHGAKSNLHGLKPEGVRDSQTLSMGSDPAVGESPYEAHMHLDMATNRRGNANSTFLRTRSRGPFIPVARGSADSQETDPSTDFLSKHLRGSEGVSTTFPAVKNPDGSGLHGHQSEVSNDSPWPWWWSDKNRQADASHLTHVDLGASSELMARPIHEVSGPQDTKENDSQDGILHSIFGQTSQSQSDGSDTLHSPLESSSKANMQPPRPSHIIPDSGWRRKSGSEKGHSVDKPAYEDSPYFAELRRRREPHVKSVANRLSYGPSAYTMESSPFSGSSNLAQDENANEPRQPSRVRDSSSWIARGSIRV